MDIFLKDKNYVRWRFSKNLNSLLLWQLFVHFLFASVCEITSSNPLPRL